MSDIFFQDIDDGIGFGIQTCNVPDVALFSSTGYDARILLFTTNFGTPGLENINVGSAFGTSNYATNVQNEIYIGHVTEQSNVQKVVVIHGSNVGINTPFPTAALQVTSPLNSYGDAFLVNSLNSTNIPTFRITNNGQVGIGTNPLNNNILTVKGGLHVDSLTIGGNVSLGNSTLVTADGMVSSSGPGSLNYLRFNNNSLCNITNIQLQPNGSIITDNISALTKPTNSISFNDAALSNIRNITLNSSATLFTNSIKSTNTTRDIDFDNSSITNLDNVSINGDLFVSGEVIITNTSVTSADQIDISNNGTGTTLLVNQTGSVPVTQFMYNSDVVFMVKNGGQTLIGNFGNSNEATVLASSQNLHKAQLYITNENNQDAVYIKQKNSAKNILTLEGTTSSNLIHFTSSGKMGIGLPSSTREPNARIEISHQYNDPVTDYLLITNTNESQSQSNVLIVTSTGVVGINTDPFSQRYTNSTAKLIVNGTIQADNLILGTPGGSTNLITAYGITPPVGTSYLDFGTTNMSNISRVTAQYFSGDGSQLTNINVASIAIPFATTTEYGITKLVDSVSCNSVFFAATANSIFTTTCNLTLNINASSNALRSYTDAQITITSNTLRSYTDTQIAAASNVLYMDLNAQITATSNALRSYTDAQITITSNALRSYTDAQIAYASNMLYKDVNAQITATSNTLRSYTDAQIAVTSNVLYRDIYAQITATSNTLRTYTDIQITAASNVLYRDINSQITTTSNVLRSYTNAQITEASNVLYRDINAQITIASNVLYRDINAQITATSNALRTSTDIQITATSNTLRTYTDVQMNTRVSKSGDTMTGNLTVTANISAYGLSGNGSNITNLNASYITTGTVSNNRLNKATTTDAGIVQLSDSLTLNDSSIAATSYSVSTMNTDVQTRLQRNTSENTNGSLTIYAPLYAQKIGIGTGLTVNNISSALAVGGGASIGTVYNSSNASDGILLVAGKIGIGTTDPQHALDIIGDIRVTGTIFGANISNNTNNASQSNIIIESINALASNTVNFSGINASNINKINANTLYVSQIGSGSATSCNINGSIDFIGSTLINIANVNTNSINGTSVSSFATTTSVNNLFVNFQPIIYNIIGTQLYYASLAFASNINTSNINVSETLNTNTLNTSILNTPSISSSTNQVSFNYNRVLDIDSLIVRSNITVQLTGPNTYTNLPSDLVKLDAVTGRILDQYISSNIVRLMSDGTINPTMLPVEKLARSSLVRAANNFGIGTRFPTQKLHVNNGNIALTGGRFGIGTTTTPLGTCYINDNNGGVPSLRIDNSGSYDTVNINGQNNIPLFYICANCNIGINTAAPQYKLDVNGTTNTAGLRTNTIASSSGTIDCTLTSLSNIHNITVNNLTVKNSIIIPSTITTSLTTNQLFTNTISASTNTNIQVTNALHISGYDTTLYINSNSTFGTPLIYNQIGLRVNNNIMTQALLTISDRRIKNNIYISDSNSDLNSILQIPVHTYNFIDTTGSTSTTSTTPIIGFIAQEIESIVPNVINTTTHAIPSLMRICNIRDSTILYYDDTLCSDNELVAGSKIKIVYSGQEIIRTVMHVLVINNTVEIHIDAPIDAPNQVLVYGRIVNDFKLINNDRLMPLVCNSIKSLYNKITNQQNIIDTLIQRLDAMEQTIYNK